MISLPTDSRRVTLQPPAACPHDNGGFLTPAEPARLPHDNDPFLTQLELAGGLYPALITNAPFVTPAAVTPAAAAAAAASEQEHRGDNIGRDIAPRFTIFEASGEEPVQEEINGSDEEEATVADEDENMNMAADATQVSFHSLQDHCQCWRSWLHILINRGLL